MATTHENSNKAPPHEKEKPEVKSDHRAQAETETLQVLLTINPSSGSVVKIEKVDLDGKHQKLTKEEVLSLVGKDDFREIETALDEAFEAGILSVLDPSGDPEIEVKASDESDEEMELRRALLAGIVGRGVRRRLQRRLVQRLVLSRATQH